MHVQPFVPFLSSRISIFSFMSTTDAPLATAGGAADSALRIFSASVLGGLTGPTFTGAAGAGLDTVGGAGLGAGVCADGIVTKAIANATAVETDSTRRDMGPPGKKAPL